MIHTFSRNGVHVVLDVNSGAVHIVDELCIALLDRVPDVQAPDCPRAVLDELAARYPRGEVAEAYAELRELWQTGQLYSSDDSYRDIAHKLELSPVKAMCLHMAHDCNLRCAYCFAGTGNYGGERELMDEATALRAIDFLIERSGGRRNLEVDFFGGEPTINLGVVKSVVTYARAREQQAGKRFRFTITTNGLLLNEDNIRYIDDEMGNVVLSLDGRPCTNDALRRTVSGDGSYRYVVDNMKRFVKARGDREYYVRGTFTKNNLDFADDVLSLYDEGFTQLSVEPVVTDPSVSYALAESDLPAIYAEYDRLCDIILEKKRAGEQINFFHFSLDLQSGPCAIKRLRGCGCGNEYVAVTPSGDIYPCHQFAGVKEYRLGNVWRDGLREDIREQFAKTTLYDKPACDGCFAKFFCSGGCNANNYTYNGDITKPTELMCALMRKRIECGLYLKAALAEA